MKPENFAEFVIWYYIISTLVLYFLGAQFLAVPGLAWLLFLWLVKKLWQQTEDTPLDDKVTIPLGVWIWICCIPIIGFALIIGHLDFGYSLLKIVKSFINFFLRTWALLALFPLAGCLKIRPQIIYRAVCILCLQCFFLTIICYIAYFAGLELPKYTSTVLAKLGGNDPSYYSVSLFLLEGGEKFRLMLFTPWPPALAFAGNVYFFLASQDRNKFWRWIGMISSALMIWASASRLGLLCLLVMPIVRYILSSLVRPTTQFMAAVGTFTVGIFGYQISVALQEFERFFESQRSSSSYVRATVTKMAIRSWWTEAQIWGHGVKAPRGPQVVQFMPLGSHHTWVGVLYVHGLVGFIALAIPMLYSFVDLLIKSQKSEVAQTGLTMLLIFLLFSMGENLETLAYIYWPGLVMLGIALNEPFFAVRTSKRSTNAFETFTSS